MLRASATADFSAFAEALDRAARLRPRSGQPGGGLPLCRAMVNQALRNIRVCCTKRVEFRNNAHRFWLDDELRIRHVCRCVSLVSACRVQSCREKLRSKSPWIAR